LFGIADGGTYEEETPISRAGKLRECYDVRTLVGTPGLEESPSGVKKPSGSSGAEVEGKKAVPFCPESKLLKDLTELTWRLPGFWENALWGIISMTALSRSDFSTTPREGWTRKTNAGERPLGKV